MSDVQTAFTSDRAIKCARCEKQRWRPRIPEALHGWLYWSFGRWFCPDCQTPAEREKAQR